MVTTMPDIVHVHTPLAALVTRLAAHRLPAVRRPSIVYTAHGFHFYSGGSPVSNLLFRSAERIAGRWTDRLIVINDEDERAARKFRLVPTRRLVRMRGVGVDTSYYTSLRASPDEESEVLARLGMPPGSRYFVVVAEFTPNKRHADVLRALARMEDAEAHVVFAGDGPLRASMQDLANQLGLRDRVRFMGFVDDVRPLLRHATAAILASGREGLPRSIMESLAVATPVISSAARGVGELLYPDRGIVVPVGDVREFARAMDWLLAHPAEARGMGLEGQRKMRESYELQVVIAEHERLYADVMIERRKSRQGSRG